MSSITETAAGEAGIPWGRLIAGVVLRSLSFFAVVASALFLVATIYREAGGNPGFIGERILGAGVLGALVAAFTWLITLLVLAVRARRRGDRWGVRVNYISVAAVAVVIGLIALLLPSAA
jgi:hypothetical protein